MLWRVAIVWAMASLSFGQQPAAGKLLIARESLTDANFARSVILIVQYDGEKGAMGLILNRRTTIPVSRLFPKSKKADPVYLGGPVETTTAQAVGRLATKADQVTHVLGDVYATGNKEFIEKAIAAGARPSRFRIYVGYAGWGAGQLEGEIELGAWSVLKGRVESMFDDDPDTLWPRLTKEAEREAEMQIAELRLVLPPPQLAQRLLLRPDLVQRIALK